MRIPLLLLAVVAVCLSALPSTPVSPAAATTVFAAEMSTNEATPVMDYCQRYCHGSPGQQYCSWSPSLKNGCHHINFEGNCIYWLCVKLPPPPPPIDE